MLGHTTVRTNYTLTAMITEIIALKKKNYRRTILCTMISF